MLGEKFLKLTGMSLGAFLAMLLAANWREVVPAAEWIVALIVRATQALPGGPMGPIASLLFGMAAWGVAVVHKDIFTSRPQTWGDLCALAVGLGVMYVMHRVFGTTPQQLGLALLFGFGMGLIAIIGARLAWNFLTPPKAPQS